MLVYMELDDAHVQIQLQGHTNVAKRVKLNLKPNT